MVQSQPGTSVLGEVNVFNVQSLFSNSTSVSLLLITLSLVTNVNKSNLTSSISCFVIS